MQITNICINNFNQLYKKTYIYSESYRQWTMDNLFLKLYSTRSLYVSCKIVFSTTLQVATKNEWMFNDTPAQI